MSIAKGKIYVNKAELAKLFGLPEDVEILFVEEDKFNNGLEFVIASAEEVEINGFKITREPNDNYSLFRRITLNTIERLKNGEEPYDTGAILFRDSPAVIATEPMNLEINVNVEKNNIKNAQEIAKSIVDGIKNKAKRDGK